MSSSLDPGKPDSLSHWRAVAARIAHSAKANTTEAVYSQRGVVFPQSYWHYPNPMHPPKGTP